MGGWRREKEGMEWGRMKEERGGGGEGRRREGGSEWVVKQS